MKVVLTVRNPVVKEKERQAKKVISMKVAYQDNSDVFRVYTSLLELLKRTRTGVEQIPPIHEEGAMAPAFVRCGIASSEEQEVKIQGLSASPTERPQRQTTETISIGSVMPFNVTNRGSDPL